MPGELPSPVMSRARGDISGSARSHGLILGRLEVHDRAEANSEPTKGAV